MTALTLQMAQAATTDSLAVHIEDMHCRKCADRINARLSKVEGVDTVTFRIIIRTAMLATATSCCLPNRLRNLRRKR